MRSGKRARIWLAAIASALLATVLVACGSDDDSSGALGTAGAGRSGTAGAMSVAGTAGTAGAAVAGANNDTGAGAGGVGGAFDFGPKDIQCPRRRPAEVGEKGGDGVSSFDLPIQRRVA